MNTSFHGLIGAFALGFSILSLGCPSSKNVAAKVDCQNLQKYKSDLGLFNGPDFDLGMVAFVDTTSHKAGFIGSLNKDSVNKYTDSTTLKEMTSIASSAETKITFSAEIPSTVQADLKTAVSNNTRFIFQNHKRKYLKNPINLANEAKDIVKTIADASKRNTKAVFFLVHSVIIADSCYFGLKDTTSVGANVNVVTIGKFNFEVAYDCQGALATHAKGGAILYKVDFLAYDSKADVLFIDTKTDIDLRTYDFANTLK